MPNSPTEKSTAKGYAHAIGAATFLAGITPFSFLDAADLAWAAEKVKSISHPADVKLFTQGISRVNALHIIVSGAARRHFEGEDHGMEGSLLGEGDLFGGISMLLNDGICIRSLHTTEPTQFLLLAKADFFEICQNNKQFLEFFTDTFGKRMLDRSYAAIVSKTIQPSEESLHFLNRRVDSIARKNPLFCSEETTIQTAAGLMREKRCSTILVRNRDGRFTGIVTDNDLRNKVVATGMDIRQPVTVIMSFPLETIAAEALIVEAVMTMLQTRCKSLPVTGDNREMVGILTNTDILAARGQSPLLLGREVASASSIADLREQYRRLPGVIQSMIASGAKAENITRLISVIADAVRDRVIDLALDGCGPPPCPFAFMVMGSEGRREQTLKTDQDNAIIYRDGNDSENRERHTYFLTLASVICSSLNEIGYHFCKGGVMAQNPRWCQPLAVWKSNLRSWFREAEPEDVLRSAIFFDFRCARGDRDLVDDLRRCLGNELAQWPQFLGYLAMNAQHFRPPLGFFRNFLVESKGVHRDTFDMKKVMTPIVDFARIHALKNGIEATSTPERLRRAAATETMSRDLCMEMEQAHAFLMQLRISRQVHAVMVERTPPDNHLNPDKLTKIEQTMLREIFSRIARMQKELAFALQGP